MLSLPQGAASSGNYEHQHARGGADGTLGDRAITVTISIPDELTAGGGPTLLRQVLTSVLTTAINFNGDGASVTVTASASRNSGHTESR